MKHLLWLALLSLALAASFSSCATPPASSEPGGDPFVDTRRVYYSAPEGEDPKLKREYRVLVHPDGLVEQHGPETEWYESGGVKAKREFRHAVPAGVWETWFENGVLRSRVAFGDGQTPEPIQWWHDNGELAGEGSGIAGVKDGDWTFWFPSGAKSSAGAYANGARTGTWTFWFEPGTKRAEGVYESGQRVGRWELWDEQGNLVLKQALPASADPRFDGGDRLPGTDR